MGCTGRLGSLNRLGGLELGTIGVESEVPVGGVMGVNEGVAVGVRFLNLLSDGCGDNLLSDGCRGTGTGGQGDTGTGCRCRACCGCLGCGSGCVFFSEIGVKRSGILTSGWNMISFQDFESVLSSGIFNGDNISVIIYIGILANSFSVSRCFFTENLSIFCCECSAGAAISGIKALFF